MSKPVTKVCARCGYVFLTDETAVNCGCGGVLKVSKRKLRPST